MAKQLVFEQDARGAVLRGVETLARAVKSTLGPRGRNAVLDRGFGGPNVTKDGVTVAEEVELIDKFENMGVQMVKEVASKTSDVAGDGTTTATVLAEAIFREGLRHVVSGANPMALNRGIHKAVETIIAELRRMSKEVEGKEKIGQVASIAANNDKTIGDMIADAMEKVGRDGVITVEKGRAIETAVNVVEGMAFDRGYLSPHFVTDQDAMEAVLDDAYILIHEEKISAVKKLIPLLEQISKAKKPLLIIAEDIAGEALATLVVNKLRGICQVCAVKAPGYGDRRKAMLQDLAAVTGGKALFKDLGFDLEKVKLSELGRAKKITVDADQTIVLDGKGNQADVAGRVKQIRREVEETTSDYDREKLQERLAKLTGGIAQINVGGATETEVNEKKARVEDALHATRAAIEEGILPGGGVALVRARKVLDTLKLEGDEAYGVEIVRKACGTPLRTIAMNAGFDGGVVAKKVEDGKDAFGFNAETLTYGDLFAQGVIDPTKVTRSALQNAASVAALMLTTDCLIAEKPAEKDDEHDHGHHHGMGGMGDMDF